ncbi:hypothetical protein E4634_01285 [Mangrovimicrobium sediminis]|uniref:Cytochrome c domain-containing protein n=1 Tax=Mangrovimicrobium sediminis TaxID=2562682 RepID=A0A4Z0M9Z2_9GAMM|nr:PQQ-dependent sugar dehydrogenase [Haliea sp. SAOS-164]TGD76207.1 hypothetical protein E4634_01285 [Haliea sp. SAOS-164]
MSWWLKLLIGLALLLALIAGGATWYLSTSDQREPSKLAFAEHCADCHGDGLQGTSAGPDLVSGALAHGDTVPQLMASIVERHPGSDVADWRESISSESIKALALYVAERRRAWPSTSDSYFLDVEEQVVSSQYHRFRVEKVAELVARPYAIAPLPDGRILVAEKSRGLSMVTPDGVQGEPIAGSPEVWAPIATVRGSQLTLGSLLDVELHPAFADNGWIYLSHTHRCQLDCGSPWPVSMVRVLRGRLRDGQWVDEELIWSVDPDYYTVVPDAVACGRLAFDNAGHVYVTVGGKAPYSNLHKLDTPYGKVHRVRDDGTVPEDNPFYLPESERQEGSTRHTVYSYGHRTAQGLAAAPGGQAIWNTEMGPRGGDEVNRIEAGGNYGWPLYTGGIDYSGEPVTIGEDLGLDFAYEDTVPPVVEFTPAPAISSFTFHRGEQFPGWENDMLIGSLKARTLYRVRLRDGVEVEREALATNLGRIRDVEMGADGLVYLAVEHGDNGSLLRLVPTSEPM